MPALVVSDFKGMLPRETPRSMGANGAQTHHNLLATQSDFRPLGQDDEVATCDPDAKSLYRMMRLPDGSPREGENGAWITSPDLLQYVRGQVNDDATERTVVSHRGGTQPPKVLTADGDLRLLGVPRPQTISLTPNEVGQFTREDAATWLSEEMQPAVQAALLANLDDLDRSRRYGPNGPLAGAYGMHGLTLWVDRPWSALKLLPASLAGTSLGSLVVSDGGSASTGIPFEIAPVWGILNVAGFQAALRAVENPKDGSQAIGDDLISKITEAVQARLSPASTEIKQWRDELDEAVLRGIKAIENATPGSDPAPRPTPPTKPTSREWLAGPDPSGPGGGGGESSFEWHRNPEWVQYDEDMAEYEEDLREWEDAQTRGAISVADAMTIVQQSQRDSERLSNAIEDFYFALKGDINASASEFLGSDFLSNLDVDPDRVIETRFYIATYVTDRGEESAPSPVSEMVEIDQNDSVSVTVPAPPPDRHITHWRLYRSSVASLQSEFLFVDEMLISTRTYDDALKGEQLREPCPSMTWLEPPTRVDSSSPATIKPLKGPDPYLRGVVGMPNGFVAGFLDNYVAFSESYTPWAWPMEFQITTDTPVVGLGVFGHTLFVGTHANPYLMTGADPATVSAVKLDDDQACVSARSIATYDGGVIYASPDGLCHASASGIMLITQQLFAREDWQTMNPASVVGATHEGIYYFWCDAGAFALDFNAKKLGTVNLPSGPIHKDVITDHLYVASGGKVYRLFTGEPREAVWRSGKVALPAQMPFAWVAVDGEHSAAQPVTVEWFGDGVLRMTRTIKDNRPLRMPPGRYREHEVRLTSTARFNRVAIAGNTEDLKGAP